MCDLDAANKLWMGDVRTITAGMGLCSSFVTHLVGVLHGRRVLDVCVCTVWFSRAIHSLDQKLPDWVMPSASV